MPSAHFEQSNTYVYSSTLPTSLFASDLHRDLGVAQRPEFWIICTVPSPFSSSSRMLPSIGPQTSMVIPHSSCYSHFHLLHPLLHLTPGNLTSPRASAPVYGQPSWPALLFPVHSRLRNWSQLSSSYLPLIPHHLSPFLRLVCLRFIPPYILAPFCTYLSKTTKSSTKSRDTEKVFGHQTHFKIIKPHTFIRISSLARFPILDLDQNWFSSLTVYDSSPQSLLRSLLPLLTAIPLSAS